MTTPLRSRLCLLALAAFMLPLFAQQPVLPYTAPDVQAVLAGKAPLRVLMVSRKSMLAWKGDGEVQALPQAGGTPLYTAAAGEQVGVVRVPEDQSVSLRKNSQNFCPAPGMIRLESAKPIKLWTPYPDTWTTYPAPVIITPLADGSFSISREMALDDYLRNVVPAEMPTNFHPQALRAQAIIARTYTLTALGRHAADGADLCATVHCQAFSPEANRSKATDDAVSDTRGVVLMYGDKLAEPYYHADCGGATDDAGYVWGPDKARPYLTGGVDSKAVKLPAAVCCDDILAVSDPYCKAAPNLRWMRQFTAAEVNTLVGQNLSKVTGDPAVKITTVTNMAVESRTPFGRVATLRVEGDGTSVLVYGDQIRWLFGNGAPGADGLWSTLFNLTVTRDAANVITGYTVTGAGRGHGLGLCQWGADGRAKAGQSYKEILKAYYPGTRLNK